MRRFMSTLTKAAPSIVRCVRNIGRRYLQLMHSSASYPTVADRARSVGWNIMVRRNSIKSKNDDFRSLPSVFDRDGSVAG